MFHKSYKLNIPLLGVTEFFNFFGITTFWLLFLSQKGMTLFQIGLLESIFHATSFLSEVPSGLLADRFTYKSNLVMSRVLTILSALCMLLAYGHFWGYGLGMVLGAWSYNFDSGTSSAMLYESSKVIGLDGNYLKYTSVLSGISEATRALGMVIAAFFVHGFLDYTYAIQILLSLCSLVAILWLKEPVVKKKHEDNVSLKKLISSVYKTFKFHPKLFRWMVVSQTMITVCSMFYFYYQTRLSHLSSWEISLVMVASCFVNILAVTLSNALGRKFSVNQVFKIILAMEALLYLFVYFNNPISYSIIFLLSDGLIALFIPIYSTDIHQRIPSQVRATLLSVSSMLGSLSMVIVFPLTGIIIDKLGFSISFLLIGIFITTILILNFKE